MLYSSHKEKMEKLISEAKKIGVEINAEQVTKFKAFLDMLQKANTETNLTAITETKDIILKHFIDSISILPFIPKNTVSVVDIGSGAGFPGIPVKIVRPEIEVSLLEATAKKANFIEQVTKELNLPKTKIINARAEDAGQDLRYREQFDVALGRAVAQMRVLAEYALPFVKVGGFFIAQKDAEEDIATAEKAIQTLGGEIQDIVPIKIEGLSERNIVIVKKTSPTIDKYPRRPGNPEKKPIQ